MPSHQVGWRHEVEHLSPQKVELDFYWYRYVFMMIAFFFFMLSFPTCSSQCSASRSCCAFLTCEGSICRDKAVVIEGTETFGYNPGNNLDNRFGEGENVSNSTQVPTAPVNTKCSEIGSKVWIAFGMVYWFKWRKSFLLQCFDESDCCRNLRCHGFLHQCVT